MSQALIVLFSSLFLIWSAFRKFLFSFVFIWIGLSFWFEFSNWNPARDWGPFVRICVNFELYAGDDAGIVWDLPLQASRWKYQHWSRIDSITVHYNVEIVMVTDWSFATFKLQDLRSWNVSWINVESTIS